MWVEDVLKRGVSTTSSWDGDRWSQVEDVLKKGIKIS
jgi:hypothetical protein